MYLKCSKCGEITNEDNLEEIDCDEIMGCIKNGDSHNLICSEFNGDCQFEFDDMSCKEFRKNNEVKLIKVEDLE